MGKLVLVPTPIDDHLQIDVHAKEELLQNCLLKDVLILVEEHKVLRRKWLRWGLPREAIETFRLLNEHTSLDEIHDYLQMIKSGVSAYLFSDCGLPAFCDPGQALVDLCHLHAQKVTSTPFPNSIALSVALSGYPHQRFIFSGFIPSKSGARESWLRKELLSKDVMIWMDTPYRLKKLLEDISHLESSREFFLALDLNSPDEALLRGTAQKILLSPEVQRKREFVLVWSPK